MSKETARASFDYEFDAEDSGKRFWIVLAIMAVLVGAFILLRTEPTNLEGVDELTATLKDGQPTVIEFYSNF